jgi:erythromycin esterase
MSIAGAEEATPMGRLARLMRREEPSTESLVALVRERARPLGGPADLDPLMDRIGDARFVLLGEASHGTSEYYTWRAEITRRLVREKGFSFVAVEGDWPACEHVDRFIRGRGDSPGDGREMLQAFDRWPTWMWANEEVADLAGWLREFNRTRASDRHVGFHGLDVYSLWDSLYAVAGYLRRVDPSAMDAARRALHCFEPYGEDAQEYALATRFVPETCEGEVIALLARMRQEAQRLEHAEGRDAAFRAEQEALVVKNAEAYYRAMVRGGPESWNIRDRHMAETLDRLAGHYGPRSKAIVWEHNTHIGDARYTDMAGDGMFNVGQLTRQGHAGDGVVLVGFGSHRGSVIAGKAWEAPLERMEVPPARPGSWEDLMHRSGRRDALFVFSGKDEPAPFQEWRGHRAIGVVYNPENEHLGNYVPTVLPGRYDAFLYLDETHALRPLPVLPRMEREVPETFPSGR